MVTTNERALAIERDALSVQLDDAHQAGAALVLERDQYVRDFEAMSARAVDRAERVTVLEVELEATKRELAIAAATTEHACERIGRLADRIATIASEALGSITQQNAEENLCAIERSILALRHAIVEGDTRGRRRRRGRRGAR